MITQVISSMTVTLCMLIDNIVIARFLGVEAMAAYGYTQPVLLAFAAPGAMISAGIQVVCGRTLGSGDKEGTDSCFTLSVGITALISVLGLAAVLLFASPLCTILGAGQATPENSVFFLTKDYLTGFIIGVPAFLFAQIMVPYLQMSGNRTRLVSAVLVMTVLDVSFDLLNVLVIDGGIFGMGLASSLSYYSAVIIGIGVFFKKDCIFKLKWKGLDPGILKDMMASGIPTIINQLSLVFLILLLNNLLRSAGGHEAVAAYSVISTVGNLCYAFCNGNSSVALMMASIFYADEDRSSIYTLVRTMRRSAIALLASVTVLVVVLARPIVGFFLDDPYTLRLAEEGMRLFALCLVPCALNTTFKFYYQGIERVKLMELISVLQNLALPAIAALVLRVLMGTTGLWLCFLFGEGSALLFIGIYVWIKNRRISLAAEDFSLLPVTFGVPKEDCFECTVGSIEEAVEASGNAIEFCRAHGIDKKTGVMIGLCIEEIAINTVTHGFVLDNRKNTIEVRLVFRDDCEIIRIRDNCAGFDPVHYHKLHLDDDPIAHMGIRTVVSFAKEAVYLNTFGLNNLMLRL